jgi:hypothetical protein
VYHQTVHPSHLYYYLRTFTSAPLIHQPRHNQEANHSAAEERKYKKNPRIRLACDMAPPSAIEVSAETDTTGVTIPNPLTAPITSNDILGRRKKANKSQWGIAAGSNTANFRQKSYENKPKAKRWDRKYYFNVTMI